MQDFYRLPMLYDVLHAPGTAEELDGLERMAGRYARRPARRWLEPACGTGRLVRLAAQRGISCVGFDISEPMVAYARERLERVTGCKPVPAAKTVPPGQAAPPAEVHVADMAEFADICGVGAFDFAFCTINTIRHIESDKAMRGHLAEMRRALRPDGVYAVGISLSAYGYESPSEDVWEGRRGSLHVRQLVSYMPPERGERIERVVSILHVNRPRGEEQIESTYTLRTYDEAEWRGVIDSASWEVLAVCDESGSEIELREPGYGVFILRPA